MLPMSDRYRTMSDTRSIGLRHNVRHVKNFFRNTVVVWEKAGKNQFLIIFHTEKIILL